MNNKSIPHWKIKGLKKAKALLSFESFDIFPSNRRAGIYCSALKRQGLIEPTGVTYFGNNTYEITLKGLEFINQIEA
jgi:hypothetical protein